MAMRVAVAACSRPATALQRSCRLGREPVQPIDARSGSHFERVLIDGQPHFLKVLGYRTDWIMRVTGDRDQRTFRIWQAGLLHRFPAEIDHTVVAMARDGDGLDAELGILMRDVGEWLAHRRRTAASRGPDHGEHPDGRTILVDCAYPGSGPPCWDLVWYLALNRARLPVEKAEVIAQFRAALDRRGWDTDGWFDQQLALCQLAMISAFGWERALGAGDAAGDAELDWWQQRALAAARGLDEAAPG